MTLRGAPRVRPDPAVIHRKGRFVKKTIACLALAALVSCEEAEIYTAPIAGPRTKDANVFARTFLDQMQARSFEANREFCGLFGRDAEGYIIATPPLLGRLDTCRPPYPEDGFNTFASYHSHGAFDYDADSEVPSSNDLLADQAEEVMGYISTPGGRIWLSDDGKAKQVCGLGCITVDPRFEPRVYGPVQQRYTIAQLRRRENT